MPEAVRDERAAAPSAKQRALARPRAAERRGRGHARPRARPACRTRNTAGTPAASVPARRPSREIVDEVPREPGATRLPRGPPARARCPAAGTRASRHRQHQIEGRSPRQASRWRRSASAACPPSSSGRRRRTAAAPSRLTGRRPGMPSPASESRTSEPGDRDVVGGNDPGRAAHAVLRSSKRACALPSAARAKAR